MEIHKLHDLLNEAGIEHEWLDRTPSEWEKLPPHLKENIDWGWQVVVYRDDGERLISAIEGYGSYGYMNWRDPAQPGDSIEIMGLLTPEEEEYDCVRGYLSAEEVFGRIVRALAGGADAEP